MSVLLLATNPAAAQRGSELSADLPDTRILRIQQKVEALFVSGEFERALFIYLNELSPLGDKYAQYMVGYMHETGLGTDKNQIVASAWYRLAAERYTPEFMQIRDKMMSSLTPGEKAESDTLYSDLRRQYGDLAVIMASIKRDAEAMEDVTGSRLGGSSSAPVTMVDPRTGSLRIGADYYREIERRMYARIKLLVEVGGFDEFDEEPAKVNVHDLERAVNERLSLIED